MLTRGDKMKLDGKRILDDVKAKSLGIAEDAIIKAVDAALDSVKAQALEQPTDPWAIGVGIVMSPVKQALDSELSKLLPDASKS